MKIGFITDKLAPIAAGGDVGKYTSLRLVGLILAAASAAAGNVINFTGDFVADDDVVLFNYTVQSTEFVTVATTSYALGGFQTILTLFDNAGNFLFDNSGYASATDATLSWNSLAGAQYIIALTQYDNYSLQTTLGAGFVEQGNGNFTAAPPFNNSTPGGKFLLPGGEQRTSSWAVEFSSLDDTLIAELVPEPSSMILLLSGGVLLWRKRSAQNQN